MANILLLDESDVAGRAFQGIVARGQHRCFVAPKPDIAWRMLREGVVFDLVFMEMKLNSGGAPFLQRLRNDWYWKILPVVVYTTETDSRLVKRALALKVQNYLIKPYNDDLIHNEIAKALRNPWRDLHFEEARSFCALTGITPAGLNEMRRGVMVSFDRAAQSFPAWAESRYNEDVFQQTTALASQAEAAGIWGGVDYVRHLQEQAARGSWDAFARSAEPLDYAARLIFCHLNPSYVPDCMRTPEELAQTRDQSERQRWETADVERNGPVTNRESLLAQLKTLPGCPVVDSAAAAFQMATDERTPAMAQVMDLVAGDPGLAVQVLLAANRCEHDEMTAIEDVRGGATILGEKRLAELACSLPVVNEQLASVPPFNWAAYWMFQVGVGRLAQFICSYLEFSYLTGTAYTAGLIHDIGRLFLLKLQPHAFRSVLRHAREQRVTLPVAERKYLGCTSRDLAVAFAESEALPPAYASVLRWVEAPDQAENHADLVAMVALARHICCHAHIGSCGDPVAGMNIAMTATPAWEVLRPRLFPSLDARKFELQAHAFCLTVKADLTGHRVDHRPTRAERAAELV